MQLENPPVIEVGIEFQFNPNPEKKRWDLRTSMPFLEQFKTLLPNIEFVQAEEIRIDKRNPLGLPEKISGKISLDHMRAHGDDEKHWLEVGDDWMAYRLIRGEGTFPGFEAVLGKAFEMLDSYFQYFKPTDVHRMTLSYVDIINISVEPGSGIELDDYFQLGVKLPEHSFGPLNGFRIQLALPETTHNDKLHLVFATEPSEDGNLRFSMRWHSLCANTTSLDKENLRQRLAMANERMENCFFACFTPDGLELFNPMK